MTAVIDVSTWTCADWLRHARELDSAANAVPSEAHAWKLRDCADDARQCARILCPLDSLDEERVAGLSAAFAQLQRADLQIVADAVYSGDVQFEYLISLLANDWRIAESVAGCAGRWAP